MAEIALNTGFWSSRATGSPPAGPPHQPSAIRGRPCSCPPSWSSGPSTLGTSCFPSSPRRRSWIPRIWRGHLDRFPVQSLAATGGGHILVEASHPCDSPLLLSISLTTMTVQMLATNQGRPPPAYTAVRRLSQPTRAVPIPPSRMAPGAGTGTVVMAPLKPLFPVLAVSSMFLKPVETP